MISELTIGLSEDAIDPQQGGEPRLGKLIQGAGSTSFGCDRGVVDAVVVPSRSLPQAASRMPSASGVIKVFANLTKSLLVRVGNTRSMGSGRAQDRRGA
jgi:hypothetical protein